MILKKALIVGMAALAIGAIGTTTILANANGMSIKQVSGDAMTYTIALNSAKKIHTGEASGEVAYGNIQTSEGNSVSLAFKNVKSDTGSWQTLKKDGLIYNYYKASETHKNKISGLKRIGFTTSSAETTLKVSFGWLLSGDSVVTWDKPVELVAGTPIDVGGSPTYFKLENSKNDDVAITTLDIQYDCNEIAYSGPTGTYKGSVNIKVSVLTSFSVNLTASFGNNHKYVVRGAGKDVLPSEYYYNPFSGTMTFPTTGGYTYSSMTVSYGTITMNYNSQNNKIESVSLSGTIKNYVTSVSALARPTIYDELDDGNSALQSKFVRRYKTNGDWQVDSGNENRLQKNTSNKVSGGSSMKMRIGGSGFQTGIATKDGYITDTSVKNISFWYRNGRGKNFGLKVFVYQAAEFGSNKEVVEFSIPNDTEWHYYEVGFGDVLKAVSFQLYHPNINGSETTFCDIDCLSLF